MHFPLFAAFALLLALPVGSVRAQQGGQTPEPRRSELPESVLRAERQTGGEVLRAESMQRDGREVYRLKVLTPDGRVRIMRDDPRERRREAWRESRRDALRDPFDEPTRADEPSPGTRAAFDEPRSSRFDAPPSTPPPADLAVPETLPPVERGDRH